jgi:hypothetical protein
MPWVFRDFWFLCGGLWLINVAVWRFRLRHVVEQGTITQRETDRFLAWAAGVLCGVPMLLGVIGRIAHWSSPLCYGFLRFDSAAKASVSLIVLACWTAALWWIWRGGGDEFLGRVGPALGKYPRYDTTWSPSTVRLLASVLILGSGIAPTIASHTTEFPPQLACQIAR